MNPPIWILEDGPLISEVVLSQVEIGVVTRPGPHGARGAVVPRLPQKTLSLLWYIDYLS
jgi:hypothetical protein